MARFSFLEWPVLRQLRTSDRTGRGESVVSQKTRETAPRTTTADKVGQSVCPYCAVGCGQEVFVKDAQVGQGVWHYCAVGCGQKVFAKDDKVVQIEGDPDSPISRGRLCPKGAASEQLVNSPGRVTDVLYRAPKAKDWTKIELDTAIDMIA